MKRKRRIRWETQKKSRDTTKREWPIRGLWKTKRKRGRSLLFEKKIHDLDSPELRGKKPIKKKHKQREGSPGQTDTCFAEEHTTLFFLWEGAGPCVNTKEKKRGIG